MRLTPSPCHKLSHLLGPLPTSSVTYFMDGPYVGCVRWLVVSGVRVANLKSLWRGLSARTLGFSVVVCSLLLCCLLMN